MYFYKLLYVDKTNLKYKYGNCNIVANLEVFDTRHDLWAPQKKLHMQFLSSTDAYYIRGGLVSFQKFINSY